MKDVFGTTSMELEAKSSNHMTREFNHIVGGLGDLRSSSGVERSSKELFEAKHHSNRRSNSNELTFSPHNKEVKNTL